MSRSCRWRGSRGWMLSLLGEVEVERSGLLSGSLAAWQ